MKTINQDKENSLSVNHLKIQLSGANKKHTQNICSNRTQNSIKTTYTNSSGNYNRNYQNMQMNSCYEWYAYKKLHNKYNTNQDDYNIKIINNLMYNENTHIVALLKDIIIEDDTDEILLTFFTAETSKRHLGKLIEYYISSCVIFPNYFILEESKFIYKNIEKKQRVINIQQYLEKKSDMLSKDTRIHVHMKEDVMFNEEVCSSLLNITTTSVVKSLMGIQKVKDKENVEQSDNVSTCSEIKDYDLLINTIDKESKPIILNKEKRYRNLCNDFNNKDNKINGNIYHHKKGKSRKMIGNNNWKLFSSSSIDKSWVYNKVIGKSANAYWCHTVRKATASKHIEDAIQSNKSNRNNSLVISKMKTICENVKQYAFKKKKKIFEFSFWSTI